MTMLRMGFSPDPGNGAGSRAIPDAVTLAGRASHSRTLDPAPGAPGTARDYGCSKTDLGRRTSSRRGEEDGSRDELGVGLEHDAGNTQERPHVIEREGLDAPGPAGQHYDDIVEITGVVESADPAGIRRARIRERRESHHREKDCAKPASRPHATSEASREAELTGTCRAWARPIRALARGLGGLGGGPVRFPAEPTCKGFR